GGPLPPAPRGPPYDSTPARLDGARWPPYHAALPWRGGSMLLGRVIGTVWATRKDEKLEGLKLLVVRQLDLEYKPQPQFLVAVDTVQAGVGEVVLVCQGSSARQTKVTEKRPVDAVVMAVVENLSVKDVA